MKHGIHQCSPKPSNDDERTLTDVALAMILSQISFGSDMYFSINRSCTTESLGVGRGCGH